VCERDRERIYFINTLRLVLGSAPIIIPPALEQSRRGAK